MEQVYYTQCPIGYGIGAANGFQIKRRTDGYPTTGDFQHLGLRAFLPGRGELAPAALRYRRDGRAAEIAYLTPRRHEYETRSTPDEPIRGWGRPGGLFAHGLRLDEAEFERIARWPAGLFAAEFWCRHDPDRTEGEPPADLTIERVAGELEARFEAVAQGAAGMPRDWLAALLAATASAAATEQTLFIIEEEADRLAPLLGLLTFAFPGPLRGDLTFSTYHDRPEELAGFRIQGTLAAARPNRAILAPLGRLAEMGRRAMEPPIEVPRWAARLAGWLVEGGPDSARAWEAVDRVARRFRPLPAGRWSDGWLDHLFAFDAATRRPAAVPMDAAGWKDLAALTVWAGEGDLGAEWSAAHDPEWWWRARPATGGGAGVQALWEQLQRPGAWQAGEGSTPEGQAAAWGKVAAAWFAGHPKGPTVFDRLLRTCPLPARGSFLASVVRGLPGESADHLIGRLKADPAFDDDLLLPVEAARCVAEARERPEPAGERRAALEAILRRARARPRATASTLEAAAREARRDAAASALLAEALGRALLAAEGEGWDAAWAWALRRADGVRWLRPFLMRVVDQPTEPPAARRLRERTPEDLRPALARAALAAALEPAVVRRAFFWCVEAFLLPCRSAHWYADPAWPGEFIERAEAPDLLARLGHEPARPTRLVRWLEGARQGKLLSAAQDAALATVQEFAESLRRRDAAMIERQGFPSDPGERRGELLRLILGHFGGAAGREFSRVLGACARAWPDGFRAGGVGLAGIAGAIADELAADLEPARWMGRLGGVLHDVGLDEDARSGFAPEGLAAHVVAATTAQAADRPATPWALRRAIFEHRRAWPILALDLRGSLSDEPDAFARGFEAWERAIVRGSDDERGRFHELLLNGCAGPRALAGAVARTAGTLAKLGPIPWWGGWPGGPDAQDARQAFARAVPMAPLVGAPNARLAEIEAWLAGESPRAEIELLPGERPEGRSRRYLAAEDWARWDGLANLTRFERERGYAPSQWAIVERWRSEGLPIGRLGERDRYAFAAAVIEAWEHYTPDQERVVSNLARWLTDQARWEPARVSNWPEALAIPMQSAPVVPRRGLVQALLLEIGDDQEAAARRPAWGDSPAPGHGV